MELVRNTKLEKGVKNLCPVPDTAKNQGLFLALARCHDMRITHVSADLNHLLKHGRVFVGKAGTVPDWVEVKSLSELPKFKASYYDNYEACSIGIDVDPYMPQFFFEPSNTFRGSKIFKKLK